MFVCVCTFILVAPYNIYVVSKMVFIIEAVGNGLTLTIFSKDDM